MLEPNIHAMRGAPLDAEDKGALDARALAEVEALLAHCPAHRPTPLFALPALAGALGVASLDVKHEAPRFGLGSFKALGGVHAVIRLLLDEAGRRLGREVSAAELRDPALREIAATLTVGCATAGNHGRSVAAGAKLVGCRAVIFVPSGASEARIAAIANLGAEVRRVAGNYDDAVAAAGGACAAEGWTVVSDTSWPGYERIPRLVMQGYTVMAAEALRPAGSAHPYLPAGRRWRLRGRGRSACLAPRHPAAAANRGGRTGARRLPLRKPPRQRLDPHRARLAERDGAARMLRALPHRLADSRAHGIGLHDHQRGGRR